MSQTGRPSQAGGDQPPKRLLEQSPSDRLAASNAVAGARAVAAGSTARAIAYGLAVAAIGGVVHVAAATLLLWTGALLVVAVTIGIVVGLAVALGGGDVLRPSSRRAIAVVLAVAAVVIAVGANWALSGMFLGPIEYVLDVYGLLVPAQLALAASGALAGSR